MKPELQIGRWIDDEISLCPGIISRKPGTAIFGGLTYAVDALPGTFSQLRLQM